MTIEHRRAGVLVPLFSCPSSRSWGIGEIGDLAPMTKWLGSAGQQVLQLLPLNEMAAGQQSPYSAISAMAIDPIYLTITDIPDIAGVAVERLLDSVQQDALARARASTRIDYATVDRLKRPVLRLAFDRFYEKEWMGGTGRAMALRRFLADESWWVHDYTLFRALHHRQGFQPWTEWPEALRRRDREALEEARRDLAIEMLFYAYLQWMASLQWQAARAVAHANGVALFGDLPFMVDSDSADVWALQDQFDLDASVGVPPDAFSETGQDWGMPVCRWDVMGRNDFQWMRDRARRSAGLYDGYRVDHLVGFYRTYARPRRGGEASFSPAAPDDQRAQGERLLTIFREAGSEVIAEDLGTVPEFVRESLARVGVPGFRVFRWERYWNLEGRPFCDPVTYPPCSVATSGTHDTEPLSVWWETATNEDRRLVCSLPSVAHGAHGLDLLDHPFTPVVRDALLEALFSSGSDLLLLPIQDIFGWSDRINEPATVTPDNWTFRLPWPSDTMDGQPEARERAGTLRAWGIAHRRLLQGQSTP